MSSNEKVREEYGINKKTLIRCLFIMFILNANRSS